MEIQIQFCLSRLYFVVFVWVHMIALFCDLCGPQDPGSVAVSKETKTILSLRSLLRQMLPSCQGKKLTLDQSGATSSNLHVIKILSLLSSIWGEITVDQCLGVISIQHVGY